jgi:hypothetical protein
MRKSRNDATPDLVASLAGPDPKNPVDFENLLLARSRR